MVLPKTGRYYRLCARGCPVRSEIRHRGQRPYANDTRPHKALSEPNGFDAPMNRTNAAGKVARDAEIVRDRARGFTWTTIATRHGVAERHARRVFADHMEAERAHYDSDPLEMVTEM